MREFLMQEIVSEKDKAKFSASIDKCAKRLYDIRDDVRVFIKCTLIIEEWEQSFPDHYSEKKKDEENTNQDYKDKFENILENKVNKVRRDYQKQDN